MATIWISQYGKLPIDGSGNDLALFNEPALADSTKVTVGSEADFAALNAATRYVLLVADVAFHYLVGTAPTADTTDQYWPADTPLVIAVSGASLISIIATA